MRIWRNWKTHRPQKPVLQVRFLLSVPESRSGNIGFIKMKATLLFIRADMILPAPEGDAVWSGDTGLTLRNTNVVIRGFSPKRTIAV